MLDLRESSAHPQDVRGFRPPLAWPMFGKRTYRIRVRRNGTDVMVLLQVFHYGEYDASGIVWSKVRRVLDAGAHIGASTLYFAAKAPDAEFACIEPQPENRELLRWNVSGRGGSPRATIVGAALWAADECVDLKIGPLSVSHQLGGARDAEASTMVEGKRVSTFLDVLGWDSVDVLKVDIEGAEKRLFEDPRAGEWLPRVGNLLVECRSHYGFGLAPAELEGLLSPHGFRVVVYDRAKGLVAAHNDCFAYAA